MVTHQKHNIIDRLFRVSVCTLTVLSLGINNYCLPVSSSSSSSSVRVFNLSPYAGALENTPDFLAQQLAAKVQPSHWEKYRKKFVDDKQKKNEDAVVLPEKISTVGQFREYVVSPLLERIGINKNIVKNVVDGTYHQSYKDSMSSILSQCHAIEEEKIRPAISEIESAGELDLDAVSRFLSGLDELSSVLETQYELRFNFYRELVLELRISVLKKCPLENPQQLKRRFIEKQLASFRKSENKIIRKEDFERYGLDDLSLFFAGTLSDLSGMENTRWLIEKIKEQFPFGVKETKGTYGGLTPAPGAPFHSTRFALSLLSQIMPALSSADKEDIFRLLLGMPYSTMSKYDPFQLSDWQQAVIEAGKSLNARQVEELFIPQVETLLSSDFGKIVEQLGNMFPNDPEAQNVVNQKIQQLGYAWSAPGAFSVKTVINNADIPVRLPGYIGVKYKALKEKVKYPRPLLGYIVADVLPADEREKALRFYHLYDSFLRLNYAILIETSMTDPSLEYLQAMLGEFAKIYRSLADNAQDDSAYGKYYGIIDADEIERRCGEVIKKLDQAASADVAKILLRLRAAEEQALDLPEDEQELPETRLINIMHQQMEMLVFSATSNSDTPYNEYFTGKKEAVNITKIESACPVYVVNLTDKPLFKVDASGYTCLDEQVSRIIDTVVQYGGRTKNAFITFTDRNIDVDLRVNDHGTNLSLTRTAPEEGGSLSFYFSGPENNSYEDLLPGEVERAEAIGGAMLKKCGLNPRMLNSGPMRKYLGACKGVFNANTGLDMQSMNDLAVMGIRNAYAVFSGLTDADADEVLEVVDNLVRSDGRTQNYNAAEAVNGELETFMNAELERLGLPRLVSSVEDMTVSEIEKAFTLQIENAVFSGRLVLDENDIPVPNPGFEENVAVLMADAADEKDAGVLAVALSKLRKNPEFVKIGNLGGFEICESVSGLGNERLVLRVLRMPENHRIVAVRAYRSRVEELGTASVPRVIVERLGFEEALDMIDDNYHLYARKFVEGIMETFSFDPFENVYQRAMLDSAELAPGVRTFPGETINSAGKGIVCGRVRIDSDAEDFVLDKGDLLVSFGFRPKGFANDENRSTLEGLWVVGQGNLLCHDASMIREQEFPVFYVNGRINEKDSTVTIVDGEGKVHVVREGETIFFDTRDHNLGLWGINKETGRQNPFYETFGHYVRRHLRGTNARELLGELEERYRQMPQYKKKEAAPVLLDLCIEYGFSDLDTLLRITDPEILKPVINRQLAKIKTTLRDMLDTFAHDRAGIRTTKEHHAIVNRFTADYVQIWEQFSRLSTFASGRDNHWAFSDVRWMLKDVFAHMETIDKAASVDEALVSAIPVGADKVEGASVKFTDYISDPDHWFVGMEESENVGVVYLKGIIGGKAARLIDIREDEGFGMHRDAALRVKEYFRSRIEPESGRSYWDIIVDKVDSIVDDDRLIKEVKRILNETGLPDSLPADLMMQYNKSGFMSVAVRSSGIGEDGAVRSFAGIGRSLINVKGADNILAAIVAVSASGSTKRVAQYLASVGDSRREIEMPVWIHPTVESQYSAVVFTRNPSNGRKQIIIQPTKGMLAPVVDGRVSADEIVFEKRDGKWTVVGFPVIRDKAFYELAAVIGNGSDRIINSLHDRRGFSLPVKVVKAILDRIELFENESELSRASAFVAGADFEVAIDIGGHVQIVQVRPITTGKLSKINSSSVRSPIETAA